MNDKGPFALLAMFWQITAAMDTAAIAALARHSGEAQQEQYIGVAEPLGGFRGFTASACNFTAPDTRTAIAFSDGQALNLYCNLLMHYRR